VFVRFPGLKALLLQDFNGYIDVKELRSVLKAFRLAFSSEAVSRMLGQFDHDGDGTIRYGCPNRFVLG